VSLHNGLYEWSRWIWPLAANHLWQATIFASLLFIAARPLKRGPAHTRYTLWLAASLKFALPSAVLIFVGSLLGLNMKGWAAWNSATAHTAPLISQVAEPLLPASLSSPASDAALFSQAVAPHNELYCAMTLTWAAGFMVCLGLWSFRRRRLAERLRTGKIVTDGREAEALRRVATRFGARFESRFGVRFGSMGMPKLLLLPGATEPGVWRTWAPVVALPEDLSSHLSDSELEAVLVHELVHVSRRDNLISNLQMLLCSVLWFHPLIWLIDRRALTERERSCDERVIQLGMACNTYAASLLKVVRFCSGWRMAGVSSATVSNIQTRLSAIIADRSVRTGALRSRLAISAVGAAVFSFSLATGILGQSVQSRSFGASCPGIAPASDLVAVPRADLPSTPVSETPSSDAGLSESGAAPVQNCSPQPDRPDLSPDISKLADQAGCKATRAATRSESRAEERALKRARTCSHVRAI